MGVALGPFWLARRIAAGRTAEVWQGVHRRDGVQVAVKFLTLGKQSSDQLEVFRREVEILGGLDHPNIVRIWDHGELPDPVPAGLEVEAGSPYLVMEQGRATLGDRKEAMPWSSVRRVAVDLLGALAHAHAHRVLHRDIKPANVLLCPAARPGEKDRVVLTDFGFASAPGEETELVGMTPGFAAPEQLAFDARSEGPWTDLFALGCVLWRLLTGKSPFDTASVEVAIAMQAKPLPPLPGVPAPIAAWLRTLLAVPWKDRPPSAAHALRALAVAEGGVPSELPADWRHERPVHPGARVLTGAGLGLVGIRGGSVGREDARDDLWAAFRAAAGGRTTVVGLRGVEGTGKTHLARWLAEEAHERWGAEEWVVTGPSAADGLLAALRRRIGVDGLPGAQARARIGAWLDATGGHGLFEARLVSWSLDAGPATTPDRWGAMLDLVRRACRRVPLVVRFEDAQEMSDLTAFLTWLLAERPDLALAAVVTRTQPGWAAPPLAPLPPPTTELHLGPLSASVTDRMLGEHLGLAPGLCGALARACAGNPGVSHRLLRRCAAAGELSVDADGRWQRLEEPLLLDETELVAAGNAVHRLLAERPEADRDLLELAATMGDVVDSALLFAAERAGGVSFERSTVAALVERGWWSTTDRGWAFVDARVAEVLRRRAAREGRAARAHELLAKVYGSVPGGAAQVRRGEHLFAAGRVADAVGPWRRGLEACLDEQPVSASTASVEAWSAAVRALGLPPDDERTAGPAELELALAVQAGDLVRVRRLGTALVAQAGDRWPDVRAAGLRALALERAEALDLVAARGLVDDALAASTRPESLALSRITDGEVAFLERDAARAEASLQAALEGAAGFGRLEARALCALALQATARGRRADARAYVKRAGSSVERTGRQADTWALREVLGRVAAARGEIDVAREHLQASAAAWEAAGQFAAARRLAVPRAVVHLADGDLAGARSAVLAAAGAPWTTVRSGALAASVAIAAAARDPAAVDRALAELTALLGARAVALPDVAWLLGLAAASLAGDPERAARCAAMEAAVSAE